MIASLKKIPFYLLLLPTFFVWHGFAQNFGFLNFSSIAMLALVYYMDTALFFLFSWLILRNRHKAALTTLCMQVFFFFFGNFTDFIKAHDPFHVLYNNVVVFPVFLALLTALFIFLKRTSRSFPRFTLFVNSLLLVYLLVDTADIIYKSIFSYPYKLSVNNAGNQALNTIPDSCKKPDIYLLLFDEYASSLSLKEQFGFDGHIDSLLTARGFSVQAHSKGNYSYTDFSMASMLNMGYLAGIDNTVGIDMEDYNTCDHLIRENKVTAFLAANGYAINNLSIFDIGDHAAQVKSYFLPLQTKIFTGATLPQRIYRDYTSFFLKNKFLSSLAGVSSFFLHEQNNKRVLTGVREAAMLHSNTPKFVYAHAMMPHNPFFYDRNGKRKDDQAIFQDSRSASPEPYLEYVRYAETAVCRLVDDIQKNTKGSAVILVMGDHGLREGSKSCDYTCSNLNAVYFPNRDYHLLKDTMTNVNQFRMVFNTLFNQQCSLLPDSITCLKNNIH